METLVAVAQHKNRDCRETRYHGHARYGSSPSINFRGISYRTFHSSPGVLYTPLTSKSYSTPASRKASTSSPKTSPSTPNLSSNAKTPVCQTLKSTPIPVVGRPSKDECTSAENVGHGCRSLSELWAGPAYSNSPPPSSLPIPKFSLPPKRTVSLDLPDSSPEVEMHPIPKSAPPSPTRNHGPSVGDLFLTANSATKTLRRILNLDIEDD